METVNIIINEVVEVVNIKVSGEGLGVEVDPQFNAWLNATPPAYPDDVKWVDEDTTHIEPSNGKYVDAKHLSGTINGGIFQP